MNAQDKAYRQFQLKMEHSRCNSQSYFHKALKGDRVLVFLGSQCYLGNVVEVTAYGYVGVRSMNDVFVRDICEEWLFVLQPETCDIYSAIRQYHSSLLKEASK